MPTDEKVNLEDFPGLLNKVKLSQGQQEVFLEYISNLRGDKLFYVLFKIFSADQSFKLIDILSGETVKIPKRKDIYRHVLYVRIYTFIKSRGYDERSVNAASKLFNKRTSSIIRIYKKVDEVLTSDNKDFVLKENEDDPTTY